LIDHSRPSHDARRRPALVDEQVRVREERSDIQHAMLAAQLDQPLVRSKRARALGEVLGPMPGDVLVG
jgi:hypothetical protein